MIFALIAAFAIMIFYMAFLNLRLLRLLLKSRGREKDAIDALDSLTNAFGNYRESHENLVEAHARNAAALQKRIDILEGALRERGVNI